MGLAHETSEPESRTSAPLRSSLLLDAAWRCLEVDEATCRLFGIPASELIGSVPWAGFPGDSGGSILHSAEIAMDRQEALSLETRWGNEDRWIECLIQPAPASVLLSFVDVTKRRRLARMGEGHREVLTGIAGQHPLKESLERIAHLHEELNPGGLCSLVLADKDRKRILHGAAPSLPDSYNRAIHGLPIGDQEGSCGTAIWRRERIIVADIANDPLWIKHRDIALRHGLHACWSTPVFGSDGEAIGTFAVYYREVREPSAFELGCIDQMLTITAIAIESARLIEKVRERDGFFELSFDIYCVVDTGAGYIAQANPAFSRLTGHSEAELCGTPYVEFIHPDDLDLVARAVGMLRSTDDRVQDVVYRFRCHDGSYRWISWTAVVAEDGRAFAVGRDITAGRQVEADLAHAASHDAVTRLPHRLVFETQLEALLVDESRPVWVLLLGIDRFQVINEFMGHLVGDEVLRRIAARLRDSLDAGARIARFAGDEFVIALGSPHRGPVVELAERLRSVVAEPMECHDYQLMLSASVGISRSPEHGQHSQDLLCHAEAAMIRAKRRGRDGICEFSVEHMKDTEDRLLLGRNLRGAIERGELSLHYQSQHRASDHRLSGFEALLRWDNPELGALSPARFIPIAETMGMMSKIGAWVLDQACRQARTWLDAGHVDFRIAINISAQELQQSSFVKTVMAALQRHSVPANVLDIELTESSLMENVERVRIALTELKAFGIRLSLDDFGTGYSSLAYLRQFPIDKLKIDQRFVRGLPFNDDDAAIAKTIIAMGHQLRMVVAAEGVETAEQAEFLGAIGCDELQGFHLGLPVRAELAALSFEFDDSPGACVKGGR